MTPVLIIARGQERRGETKGDRRKKGQVERPELKLEPVLSAVRTKN